jgi:hypothetical protein
MLINTVALIVAIVMAVWVYEEVNSHGGKLPWLWAIGAFVFWPLIATITGFKYDGTVLKMVGIMGLFIIVLGIAMAIGLVPFL